MPLIGLFQIFLLGFSFQVSINAWGQEVKTYIYSDEDLFIPALIQVEGDALIEQGFSQIKDPLIGEQEDEEEGAEKDIESARGKALSLNEEPFKQVIEITTVIRRKRQAPIEMRTEPIALEALDRPFLADYEKVMN